MEPKPLVSIGDPLRVCLEGSLRGFFLFFLIEQTLIDAGLKDLNERIPAQASGPASFD